MVLRVRFEEQGFSAPKLTLLAYVLFGFFIKLVHKPRIEAMA
jgi:hypothetical protein